MSGHARPLREFYAKNFRSLKDVRLKLAPLNVLVGPNGAGKSNFLKAIRFLGDTARYDLVPAIDARGGFGRIAFRGGKGTRKKVCLGVVAQVTEHASENAPDEYELKFWENRSGLERSESFTFKRTKGQGRRLTVKGAKYEVVSDSGEGRTTGGNLVQGSSALSTLPRLGEASGGKQLGVMARLFSTFRVFEVNVDEAKSPARVDRVDRLNDDASNLAAYLSMMSMEYPEVFSRIQEDACAVVPGLKAVQISWIGGAALSAVVELEEAGLRGVTPLADASFGTVRVLALLAMLHDPNPPPLTCVEEIDHGLHPYALDVIVERLREASRVTQILVATHSPVLVNRLRADELVICERAADGSSKIPAVCPDEVRRIAGAGELQLGELWFSGTLGGVLEG